MYNVPPPAGKSPPVLDEDVARALDQRMAAPHPGDDEVLDRVRRRVLQGIAEASPALLHTTMRAADGSWQTVAPGVQRKLLFQTADAVSCLFRFAPGAVVPAHQHPIDEECLVLEGSFRIGPDLVLLPGDFHVGRRGVAHPDIRTDTGALVYLRAARHPLGRAAAGPAHGG